MRSVVPGTRAVVKRVLRRLWPALVEERAARLLDRRLGLDVLARTVATRTGGVVRAGPFRGMRYLPASAGSALCPKLLGCYEQELHPAVEAAIARRYGVVIDVGCAEGYYAVGLAVRSPSTRVVAYDVSARARGLCRRLARMNDVADRVDVRGALAPADLAAFAGQRALLFCDCEGYESTLLDPAVAPALGRFDVIVELHEAAAPGVTAAIRDRFAATHSWQLLHAGPRDPSPAADLGLDAERAARAVDEYRDDGGAWAVLVAGAGPVTT